jgi:glycosyltransferase involved in cell wall biosynthesis
MSSPHDRENPLVSVVIPAFNAAATLNATLDSVLAQTHPRVEVVVVDDGSTDETPAVLASYGDRLRAVRQRNGGLANARNAGWRLARGDYVAIMDADDVCAPERISVQLRALQRHPEAVLCSSAFTAFDHAGFVSASHGARYYSAIRDAPDGLRSLYGQEADLEIPAGAWPSLREPLRVPVHVGRVYPALAFGNFVHPPTAMVRRDALLAAGPFDESLRWNSDWEWFVRVSRLGPFVYAERPLLDYRLSRTQMSATPTDGGFALDMVAAGHKIWNADPALARTERARMRRCRRQFYIDAAYALSERRKGMAVRMLAQGAWNGAVGLEAARTGLRILLPSGILQRIRGITRRAGGAR